MQLLLKLKTGIYTVQKRRQVKVSLVRACAGVQPWWIQGDLKVGMESASLEKYIFNYRYIERLETDSVVGKLVEKKRLNNLVYMGYQ